MKRLALAIPILLSGCAAMHQKEEYVYLALHAVDTAQTLQSARHPELFYESGSAYWMGHHPTKQSVIGWSIGSAIGQTLGAELLLRSDHPKLAKAWQYVGIGISAQAVYSNYSIGVRFDY